VKFLCEKCKAKYQIADEKVVGRTVRMKCRKCGHLIEVRAEVTESSVATKLPKAPESPPAANDQKPAEATPAAESNTPTAFLKKAARPDPAALRPVLSAQGPKPIAPIGSLAGAFRSAVEREEEPSALDMADLRAADEWYVAINGVPVGPILVAEVRRKAALGSVTEDSLVWQEGLDEWRPVRAFPELAATVREASHAGRGSLVPPPPPPRPPASAPHPMGAPPHPPASAPHPMGASPHPPESSPRPMGAPPHAPASSPRPIATPQHPAAEHPLAPASVPHAPGSAPHPFAPLHPATAGGPAAEASSAPIPFPANAAALLNGGDRPAAVVTDPFKPSPAFATAAASVREPALGPFAPPSVDFAALRATPDPEAHPARGTPWIAIAMVAAATAFGAMSAVVIWLPRAVTPPQPESTQTPTATSVAQGTLTAAPPVVASDKTGSSWNMPAPSTQADAPRRPVASAPSRPNPTATASPQALASAPSRTVDMRGIIPSTGAIPTDDSTETPKAPGQCQSEGQVQQVIAQHQTAIRRTCWERSQTEKPAASIAVTLTIAPDGSPQGVSVNGDDPTVAKCIESDLHSWHFPAMGCSQKTAFSLKFVRQ